MSKTDPRLGRVPFFDERSRQHPIRALLGTRKPRSYTWRISSGPVLDQGREGACVGFAWAAELAARPAEVKGVTNSLGMNLYRRARTLDEWYGENYDGTSVLAGAKATQETGKIAAYRWAFGLADVLDTLGHHGPCVLGINWHEGMYEPDAQGFIRPAGQIVGGHAILARAVNVRARTVTLRNSWGPSYGKGGDCRITFDDLDALLRADGEACVAVSRHA